LPVVRFLYSSLGTVAWPVSTMVLSLATANLLPFLALAGRRAQCLVIGMSGLVAAAGFAITLFLPVYSPLWPQRVNLEYWLDADSGRASFLARCDSARLPASLAAAAPFDPQPRPRFAGSAAPAFRAAAPKLALAAPELKLVSPPSAAPAASRFELHVRSARGAPVLNVVFPAAAKVAEVRVATSAGEARAWTYTLHGGGAFLNLIGLPADGATLTFDAAEGQPAVVQIFDVSYGLAEGTLLQRARAADATSSQDGDVTVVHRTVSLNPAADRADVIH
jgi:hypothetical protein